MTLTASSYASEAFEFLETYPLPVQCQFWKGNDGLYRIRVFFFDEGLFCESHTYAFKEMTHSDNCECKSFNKPNIQQNK